MFHILSYVRPLPRTKGGPSHKVEIPEPAGGEVSVDQGRFQGKSAGSTHGVNQGPGAVIADKHQGRRGDGFTNGSLSGVSFDSPLMEVFAAAVQGKGKNIIHRTYENFDPRWRVGADFGGGGARGQPFFNAFFNVAADGVRVIESGMFRCDAQCRFGSRAQEKLPWELLQPSSELSEVGCLESRETHENAVCGSKPEVGKVTSFETPAEFNSAPGYYRMSMRTRHVSEFAAQKRFKTGDGTGKKCSVPAEDMPLDPFCQWGLMGSGRQFQTPCEQRLRRQLGERSLL